MLQIWNHYGKPRLYKETRRSLQLIIDGVELTVAGFAEWTELFAFISTPLGSFNIKWWWNGAVRWSVFRSKRSLLEPLELSCSKVILIEGLLAIFAIFKCSYLYFSIINDSFQSCLFHWYSVTNLNQSFLSIRNYLTIILIVGSCQSLLKRLLKRQTNCLMIRLQLVGIQFEYMQKPI